MTPLNIDVIGATGLVGFEFVRHILNDPVARTRVKSLNLFTRRPFQMDDLNGNEKVQAETIITNHVVDFEKLNHPTEGWRDKLHGDILFSSLGTTIKQARTKEQQYKVDYHYQMEVARAFRTNGGKCLTLISAAGADARSPFFYVRMKGELERDVLKLDFERLRILRPALLKGTRASERLGEVLSDQVLTVVDKILPSGLPLSVKPIPASTVARAAFHASLKTHRGSLIFGPQDLWQLALADEEKSK